MILIDGNNLMIYGYDVLLNVINYIKSLNIIPILIINSIYKEEYQCDYIFETNNDLYIIKISFKNNDYNILRCQKELKFV